MHEWVRLHRDSKAAGQVMMTVCVCMCAAHSSPSDIHLCLNGWLVSALLGCDVWSCDTGSYINHRRRLACGPVISLLRHHKPSALYSLRHVCTIQMLSLNSSTSLQQHSFYFLSEPHTITRLKNKSFKSHINETNWNVVVPNINDRYLNVHSHVSKRDFIVQIVPKIRSDSDYIQD